MNLIDADDLWVRLMLYAKEFPIDGGKYYSKLSIRKILDEMPTHKALDVEWLVKMQKQYREDSISYALICDVLEHHGVGSSQANLDNSKTAKLDAMLKMHSGDSFDVGLYNIFEEISRLIKESTNKENL